jgi:hypothetical protein
MQESGWLQQKCSVDEALRGWRCAEGQHDRVSPPSQLRHAGRPRIDGVGVSCMAKLRMLITATADQVKEPFLWRLGKDYHVVVNVKRANFTEDGGYAYVELEGSVEEIQRATAWLQTTGMIIEPEDRSLFPADKPG